MKLSACLIVKNEKDHIEKVLESLSGFDEIVVCDTGSIDNTVELARKYTDKVFTDYEWNDDFAEARNHALSKCTGDWVLSIDADETLEPDGANTIRAVLESSDPSKLHYSLKMIAKGTLQTHKLPRLFRNDGSVKWVGIAHETLYPVQDNYIKISITYGYSTAHTLDPDRMFRILKKIVDSENGTPRDLYYYAREYYYRRNYVKASEVFEEYLVVSTWKPEEADALLYLSRCYFYTQQGDKAREACLQVININPDFKEALLFMAEIHYEPFKHKWERLASVATNEDVLFVRT